MESPAKPNAARRSWPRWSSTGYSVTRSARSKSVCGIVSPRAFAVLRLITSSNFVGCSTGRSAGVGAFEDLVDVPGRAPKDLGITRTVRHEASSLNKSPLLEHARQPRPECQLGQAHPGGDERRSVHNEETVNARALDRGEDTVEVFRDLGLNALYPHAYCCGRYLDFSRHLGVKLPVAGEHRSTG